MITTDPVRSLGALALAFALGTAPGDAAQAQTDGTEPMTFQGRVEAIRHGHVASQLNGLVAEILFSGGEQVVVGDPLIILDARDAELLVAEAEAARLGAEARLNLAERDAARVARLADRGAASQASRDDADANLATARADMAAAEVALDRARLTQSRAVIRAPIAGTISRPAVAVGTFVEAEAGPPLATIVPMDPVHVAYQVPYAVRLDTMAQTGAETLDQMFARLEVTAVIGDGRVYGHRGYPRLASTDVDPASGALTVWAVFANPDGLLRPGMAVQVMSRVIDGASSNGADR